MSVAAVAGVTAFSLIEAHARARGGGNERSRHACHACLAASRSGSNRVLDVVLESRFKAGKVVALRHSADHRILVRWTEASLRRIDPACAVPPAALAVHCGAARTRIT